MIIVFPMAGLSSRFLSAGYDMPKFMLPLSNKTVFDAVIEPFLKYNKTCTFLFIIRDDEETSSFLESRLKKYDIDNYRTSKLNHMTTGQAETVKLGLDTAKKSSEVLIFNIDTIHLNFKCCSFRDDKYIGCQGILELFVSKGANWSYAEVEAGMVTRTAEKKQISNLASNGLYYFESVEIYKETYENHFSKPMSTEKYIAPMYNTLIENGGLVKYKLLKSDDMMFCGTPSEYQNCVRVLTGPGTYKR